MLKGRVRLSKMCSVPFDPGFILCSLHNIGFVFVDLAGSSFVFQFMKKHGNLCAKAKYEAKVPPYYYIPQSCDCL